MSCVRVVASMVVSHCHQTEGHQPQAACRRQGHASCRSCSAVPLEAAEFITHISQVLGFCERAFSFIFLREQSAFRPKEIIKSSSLTPCIYQAKPFH